MENPGTNTRPAVGRRANLKSVAPGVVRILDEEFSRIPGSFLLPTQDAFGSDAGYESSRGEVKQLRPSSGPVFRVAHDAATYIVKLGRGEQEILHEHRMYQKMAPQLPVPETQVVRSSALDASVLVLEDVGDLSAAELSRTEPARFLELVEEVIACWVALTHATETADLSSLRWSLQTPQLMLQWLGQIRDLTERRIGVAPCDTALDWLRPHLHGATSHLRARPKLVALSTGDNHLHNVRVTGSAWWIIDLEFGGNYDIDYTVAKLLSSLVKHTTVLDYCREQAARFLSDRTLSVGADPIVDYLLEGRFRTSLREVALDWRRVLAYVLAKLKFRFDEDVASSVVAFAVAIRASGDRHDG